MFYFFNYAYNFLHGHILVHDIRILVIYEQVPINFNIINL